MTTGSPILNAHQPIVVTEDGTMAKHFREYMNRLNRLIPMNGTGSPEGVVDALQYSSYIDDAGATGSLLYLKILPEIGGDTTQGWIAV